MFGAVTGNVLFDFSTTNVNFRPGYAYASSLGSPDPTGLSVKIWPGFAFGFEF